MNADEVQELLFFIARREQSSPAEVRQRFGQGYSYVLDLEHPAANGWRDSFGAPPR